MYDHESFINNKKKQKQKKCKFTHILILILIILCIIIIGLLCVLIIYIIKYNNENKINNNTNTINNIKNIYNDNLIYDDKFKDAILQYYNKYVNRNDKPQVIFEIAKEKLITLYNMNMTDIISLSRCRINDNNDKNINRYIINSVCKNEDDEIHIYYKLYSCNNEQSIKIQENLNIFLDYDIKFYYTNIDYNIIIYCNIPFNNNEFGDISLYKNYISILMSTSNIHNIKYELYHMLSHIFIGKHEFNIRSYTFPYTKFINDDNNDINTERIYNFKNILNDCV
ncbi:unknown similar to AMEVITR05 [Mythimna separata entomopoxvirus 'L']|uniref:Uncharacterized protein n=1 Tax=Mythimna separata entomopoxvirus 'L' TaxID=1293572 RepID=A0A916KQH8_9POXV|nr:unknown similar to AMEVITR05 [Mythimna separata entomopoxvirus 'L']CCU56385.1 unknown similar to AMEVITR05 [Mythimna separata entomopoxvirus 'L']